MEDRLPSRVDGREVGFALEDRLQHLEKVRWLLCEAEHERREAVLVVLEVERRAVRYKVRHDFELVLSYRQVQRWGNNAMLRTSARLVNETEANVRRQLVAPLSPFLFVWLHWPRSSMTLSKSPLPARRRGCYNSNNVTGPGWCPQEPLFGSQAQGRTSGAQKLRHGDTCE